MKIRVFFHFTTLISRIKYLNFIRIFRATENKCKKTQTKTNENMNDIYSILGIHIFKQYPLLVKLPVNTFCCCLFVFGDRVSLCSPGCPGTHSVDQADLKLRDSPASL